MGNWVKYLIDNPIVFGAILLLVVVGAVASIITLFKSRVKESGGKGDTAGRRAAKSVYFQITVNKDPKYAGIADNLNNFLKNVCIPAIKAHAKSAAGRLREADLSCLEMVTGNVAPARADVLVVIKIRHEGDNVFLQVTPLDKRANSRQIDVSVSTEIKVAGTSTDALREEKVINRIIAILTDAVKGKAVTTLGSKRQSR